jgi:DNA-binding NarL/FixJ family response regulator
VQKSLPGGPHVPDSNPGGTLQGPRFLRLRGLLVEDDRATAQSLAGLLAGSPERVVTELVTVASVEEGVRQVAARFFDVVLLELGPPDGTALSAVERIAAEWPDVAVVVIAGNADAVRGHSAISAGAHGCVLKDTLTQALLMRSIRCSLERSRVVAPERRLREARVRTCVDALTSTMSAASPAGIGRAMRLKAYVGAAAEKLGIRDPWQLEAAAILSQLGDGAPYERLCRIPRLDSVGAILSQYSSLGLWDGQAGRTAPADTAISAQVLGLAIAFDDLDTNLGNPWKALRSLRELKRPFEPWVLQAFIGSRMEALEDNVDGSYMMAELLPGMVLTEDIITRDGRVVVARGLTITVALLARLRSFCATSRIIEPVKAIRRPRPAA